VLTSAHRKELKARAHSLEPVVIIGGKGLTAEVVAEIDRALKSHELIKVRAPSLERLERAQVFSAICEKTGCEAVQQVGKVFVLFRKRDEPA
jgi:putative YhbY family RNA-binding protein